MAMTVCARRRKHSLILFAMLLIIAGAAAAVTGWTDTFKLGSPVKVSGRSPFINCTADNPASQPGTPITNSEVEPRLAVNPKNTSNLVAVWSQDFWTGPSNGSRGEVAGVSFDGGKSWQDVVIPGITLCSRGSAARSADSWLTFAPNGDLYHTALGLGVANDPMTLLVSKSTDAGLNWGPVTTLEDDTGTTNFPDKDSTTADPADPKMVYVVWTRFHFVPGGPNTGLAMFSRTVDGGQTWDPPRAIFDPGANNLTHYHQIVVLPDGTLVDFFTELIQTTVQNGLAHYKYILSAIRSQDRGVTWLPAPAPIPIAEVAVCPPQTYPNPCVIDPESGQVIQNPPDLFDVAVDPGNGNLYVAWTDGRFSNFQNNSIAFSMSKDGGFTWSAPIKINKTPTNIAPGNQQAFGSAVHVAPDGTIGFAYYDFRFNDPSPGLLTDYWLVHCHPNTNCADPANWRDENRLTSASFDIEKAVVNITRLFVGDYQGTTADGGDLLSVWAQPHGTDPDSVFFQRVRVSK